MKAKSEASPSLVLEGNLNIQRAARLHSMILAHYKNNSVFNIAFDNIGSVDISFLQILCSLHRTAVADKRTIGIKGPAPEELLRVLKSTGCENPGYCEHGDDQACIWKQIMSMAGK